MCVLCHKKPVSVVVVVAELSSFVVCVIKKNFNLLDCDLFLFHFNDFLIFVFMNFQSSHPVFVGPQSECCAISKVSAAMRLPCP